MGCLLPGAGLLAILRSSASFRPPAGDPHPYLLAPEGEPSGEGAGCPQIRDLLRRKTGVPEHAFRVGARRVRWLDRRGRRAAEPRCRGVLLNSAHLDERPARGVMRVPGRLAEAQDRCHARIGAREDSRPFVAGPGADGRGDRSLGLGPALPACRKARRPVLPVEAELSSSSAKNCGSSAPTATYLPSARLVGVVVGARAVEHVPRRASSPPLRRGAEGAQMSAAAPSIIAASTTWPARRCASSSAASMPKASSIPPPPKSPTRFSGGTGPAAARADRVQRAGQRDVVDVVAGAAASGPSWPQPVMRP